MTVDIRLKLAVANGTGKSLDNIIPSDPINIQTLSLVRNITEHCTGRAGRACQIFSRAGPGRAWNLVAETGRGPGLQIGGPGRARAENFGPCSALEEF